MRSGKQQLSRDSVVVAVGGSRGITAALLEAVAIRNAPIIWILGSNILNHAGPGQSDSDAQPTRAEYLRAALSRQPTTSIAEHNRAFDRLSNAREARETIQRLTRLCGPGRVHYRACDITRSADVEGTIGEILATSGQIDLLVFGAGISRTALLSKKRLVDFQAVRDVKVLGYANLRAALAGHLPRSWCNLGSVLGFTGQLGEVDYTAGNDFLNSCAQHSMLVDDVDEYTIGWTLWDTIGLAANPVARSFFHRSGLSAGMSTAEGVQLFLAELDKDEHDPVTIHLGPAEFDMLENRFPGMRGAISDAARQPRRRRSPVAIGRRIPARDRALPDGRTLVHERTLDHENDSYLSEHLVNGRPTLPGTFGLQIGAEAAHELVADRVPVAFESIVFDRFVRLHPVHGTATIRVSAELISHTGEESRVRVRVSSDVLAPAGELLIADRLHFELDVILADHPLAAPLWAQEVAGSRIDVPDPYVLENPAVYLHGVMDTLRRTSTDGRTAEGIFTPAPGVHREPFNRFQVPALLLDGLARTSVLTMQSGHDLPLMALTSIGKVELFGAANDSVLARSFADIRLVSGPAARGPNAIAFDCAAVAADGRLIARMTSLIGTPIGQLNPQTRQFSSVRIADRPPPRPNSDGEVAVDRLLAGQGAH
jgi:NAD(P)-dependent dehydrogenase (short-subunit alcohol dehydrogenase family)